MDKPKRLAIQLHCGEWTLYFFWCPSDVVWTLDYNAASIYQSEEQAKRAIKVIRKRMGPGHGEDAILSYTDGSDE